MEKTVLVTYATKHGGTAEIAERIGESIEAAGVCAEVRPVKDASDLSGYSAVVIGSAVYIGQWRKEAVRFVKEHEAQLAQLPTWIFSSGPTGEEDSDAFMDNAPLPKSVLPIAERIHPRDTVVFHGVIDPDRSSGLDRFIVKRVGAPIADAREWDDIEAWGTGIAEAVRDS